MQGRTALFLSLLFMMNSKSMVTKKDLSSITACLFSHGIADTALQLLNYTIQAQSTNQSIYVLFSHGFGDTGKLAQVYQNGSKQYKDGLFTIPFDIYSFHYPDARVECRKIPRISCTSLAQANEIARLRDAFLAMICELKKKYGNNYKIVLYGLSRGASTIIMFLATYPELLEHVAAVILESPFDSINTIIEQKIKNLGLGKIVSAKTGHRIFSMIFGQYDPQFPSPIDVIERIDTASIPILFICSKQDTTVPYESTKKLYQKLITKNPEHVYLIELEEGKHGKILQGRQGELYQKGVFDFYKKYNLLKD